MATELCVPRQVKLTVPLTERQTEFVHDGAHYSYGITHMTVRVVTSFVQTMYHRTGERVAGWMSAYRQRMLAILV
jgi:hypothetical protein